MRIVLALCFLLTVGITHSQTKQLQQAKIDAFIEDSLNRENFELLKRKLSSDSNLKGWSKYYSSKAFSLYRAGQYDSAIVQAKKAISNFDESEPKYHVDEKSLLQANYLLGLINRLQKQYVKSNAYLYRSLELNEKYPYKYIGYIIGTLAANHLALGNNEKALHYYRQNLRDSICMGLSQPSVVVLTRMGVLYSKSYLNMPDSSLFYFNRAKNRSLQNGYSDNLPFIYCNIANFYKEHNKDSTLHFYRKSKETFETYVPDWRVAPSTTEFLQLVVNSYVDIHEGKTQEAIDNLKLVTDSLRQNVTNKDDKDILDLAYQHLVMAHEYQGNQSMAVEVLKERNGFLENFHKKELKQELAELELQYETVNNKRKISKLEEISKVNAKLLKQQRLLLLGLVGILLLSTFVGLLLFRQKNLKNKLENVSLQQRLLRSQMNPHFLFNALQKATMLITVRPDAAKDYIIKLGNLLRLTLENSRNDRVALADELTALRSYLELQSDFSKNFDFYFDVDQNIDKEMIELPPMLIQPLIENAVQHGFGAITYKGSIKILLKKLNPTTMLCTVTDNGIGYRESSTGSIRDHRSLSLQIVQERLALFHRKAGTLPLFEIRQISEEPNGPGGTEVKISIPFVAV